MQRLLDPRFTTEHYRPVAGYGRKGKFYLPQLVNETWCRPGYQPTRPDKGYDLTVNDYPFHNIQYGGENWARVVNTPFTTYN